MSSPKMCDYEIRILTTEDKPAVYEFTKKFFFTTEPLNEAMNRGGKGTLQKLTPEHCPMDYLSEELSLAALTSSGEIIGVALNERLQSKQPYATKNESQIGNLLNHVNEKITELGKTDDEEKEMDVRVITVHDNWRNKGVGRKLLEKSKELAQQKGFKRLRGVCTNAYTARMFANCGFECIYALKYEKYKEEGKLDYLPQEPHTHIKGMLLKF